MEKKNYITGLWKFRDTVPMEELTKVAQEWAQDERYLQLYIRQCSKDQYGIGFMYQYNDDDTHAARHEYGERTSDILKRKFGNDLAGWDYANPTWIIK